jgi:hypothetical protein
MKKCGLTFKNLPMKKFSLLLLSAFALLIQSCDKDDAALKDVDLSNTLPPYVEFSSTAAKTVTQGTSTTVTFQMRTGLQQKVTVYYDVTGAVNLTNQMVEIEKEKTTGTATINIPATVITPPATSATATVVLKRAVMEDGTELTIGSKNNPATQQVILNIKP